MKHKELTYYLTSVVVICLILTIILSFTYTILESLRISFGSIFVLFLPGFVITHLFLKDQDIIEKIALSFALSIAIVPLTIFYLTKLGMKINPLNSVLTIAGIIIISIIVRKLYK